MVEDLFSTTTTIQVMMNLDSRDKYIIPMCHCEASNHYSFFQLKQHILQVSLHLQLIAEQQLEAESNLELPNVQHYRV